MNSGKIVADGTGGRVDGTSKVLQEVLADLKIVFVLGSILDLFQKSVITKIKSMTINVVVSEFAS